ncbi:MAG TPA: GNAT family N-acetyltransferase [Trebonia sp.]|nr:GNAT family N-acetyltransferase [Trebonia sp.]
MATGELLITRDELVWQAHDGSTVAGEVRARRLPDGRHHLFFDAWHTDAYRPLTAAVARDLRHDLYVTLDDAEFDSIEACERAGFAEWRRESIFKIPTDAAVTGLTPATAPLPPGFTVISPEEADLNRLRLLDDDLRQDVPGTDGWRWDREGFERETFGRGYDPSTYLVAVAPDGDYAGLVRVWQNRNLPRLGLMAVRRPYRRRGITRALLRQAFGICHERGREYATAEVDDENLPSVTLLTRLGARRTGGTVELLRQA